MRRFFSPDSLPFWIMGLCLILGLISPTAGLYLGGLWSLLVISALGFTWWRNRQNLAKEYVRVGLMILGLVLSGTAGLTTIRWWLPWLGDLLRVRS